MEHHGLVPTHQAYPKSPFNNKRTPYISYAQYPFMNNCWYTCVSYNVINFLPI